MRVDVFERLHQLSMSYYAENVAGDLMSRITNDTSRFFEGTGEILLPDGEVAATGYGKYIKLPLEKIADFDATEQEWRVVHLEHDPTTIDLP